MARDIAVEEGVEDAAAESQALDDTMGPNPDGVRFRNQEPALACTASAAKLTIRVHSSSLHFDLGYPGAGGLEGPTQPGAETRLKGGIEAESQRSSCGHQEPLENLVTPTRP